MLVYGREGHTAMSEKERERERWSPHPLLNGALVTAVSTTELPSRLWIQLTCWRWQWLLSCLQYCAGQKWDKILNVPNWTLNGQISTCHSQFLQGWWVVKTLPFPCRDSWQAWVRLTCYILNVLMQGSPCVHLIVAPNHNITIARHIFLELCAPLSLPLSLTDIDPMHTTVYIKGYR